MTALARLSSWRLRLSRLCGLSQNADNSKHINVFEEMDTMSPEEPLEQDAALRDFIDRMAIMAKGNYIGVNLDFARLRTAQEALQSQEEYSTSEGTGSIHNRYRDIIPYNKNRIRLKDNGKDDEFGGDYINASMIEYPEVNRKYIAAQAPLTTTIDDFWHMVAQYKIKVIAMLCKVVENSAIKCVQYWPLKIGETMQLTDVTLETQKEEQFEDFCIREILFKSEKFGTWTVFQLHYTEWPDHGCPDTELHIPKFIETMDSYQTEHGADSPILLHCSAGCGRTGTVIGVDIIRSLIRDNKIAHKINLKNFVFELRRQRTAFVQSPSQFQLLHTLVAHYCRLALNPPTEENSVTTNTTVKPSEGSEENRLDENGSSPSPNPTEEDHDLIDIRL